MSTTTIPTPSSVHQPTKVETVLAEASRDLDNAEFHLGLVLNPLRALLWKPALDVALAILPPIASVVPILDEPTAAALSMSFDASRIVYGKLHAHQGEATYKTYKQANQAILEEDLLKRMDAHTLKGFIISATVELASDPLGNMGQWFDFTNRLLTYLRKAGIKDELHTALKSPRWVSNVRILAHVQAVQDNMDLRCHRISSCEGFTVWEFDKSPAFVAKLMRYCCAAYGQQMMEGYDLIAKKNGLEQQSDAYKSLVGSEALKQQVCDHVGIPSHYITHFCMGHGGSMKLLRHYVSTDHDMKAVILVIRGTYSVSGWHIDFQGMAVPFCHGMAHAGMAEMARSIVDAAREPLLEALQGCQGYKLIITGQSLGGGVSPLVNLLCHADPELAGYSIECHAFAGPPVYAPPIVPPDAVLKAIDNCVHYVHGKDIVPYLSVNTVRKLNAKILAIDKVTEKAGPLDTELVALGRKTPTLNMVESATYGDKDVTPIEGAPVLVMPCQVVVWFSQRQSQDDDAKTVDVDYAVCNPHHFANQAILLSVEAFSDHVPPKYEMVLNRAEETGWNRL